jgi:hypothetical protein
MKSARILLIAAVTLLLASLTGCEFLFGSDEAEITTFSVVGQTAPATIDTVNRSVVVTMEPADLSSLEVTVDISEGATLAGLPSAWSAGAAQDVTVTAENGDQAPWTITINVAYGIVFFYEGQRQFLTYGFVDSSDTYTSSQLADGLPALFADTTTTPDTRSITAASGPLEAVAATSDVVTVFMTYDAGAASTDVDAAEIFYSDDTGAALVSAATDVFDVDAVFNLVVTSLGAVGEDVTGSFDGILSADSGVTYDQDVTLGFFKVRRGEDDL